MAVTNDRTGLPGCGIANSSEPATARRYLGFQDRRHGVGPRKIGKADYGCADPDLP
jgi:hypothetical protein